MRSNTGSPGFVGKTNELCQSPSFFDQEDRGLWVRDCHWGTNIPTIWFDTHPIISFVHDANKIIPSAQTCSTCMSTNIHVKKLLLIIY